MKRHLVNIKSFPILILFVVLFAALAGCSKADNKGAKGLVEADEFKPFTTVSFDGETIDTESMRGEVVVINFWASWCGPCKVEARALEAIYKKYKDEGVNFVGIAIDDTLEGARGFIERYKITYPNAFDTDNRLAAQYEIFAVPTTYVLDREGWNTFTHRGAITKRQLEKAIKRVL